MKKGLVVEGGGLRGAFSAGALAWLLDHGIVFDYGVSMSISALYLYAYYTGNRDLLLEVSTEIAGSPDVGLKPILKEGNLVAYDKMFHQVLNARHPLDVEKLNRIEQLSESGLFNADTGEMEWLANRDVKPDLLKIKAGCVIPFYGKQQHIEGTGYFDGGVISMIPIERAMEQGCDKMLVITTKSSSYVRKSQPKPILALFRMKYGKIPNLYDYIKNRVPIYNREKEIVNQKIEEKKCIHMFPSKESGVTRFGGTHEQLVELFNIGYEDMENNKEEILKFFGE